MQEVAESKRQRGIRTERKRKKSRVKREREAREYEREPPVFDNGAVIEV